MNDLIEQLRGRIAELEAENAELRRRLEQLEHGFQKLLQRKKQTHKGRNDPKTNRADQCRK